MKIMEKRMRCPQEDSRRVGHNMNSFLAENESMEAIPKKQSFFVIIMQRVFKNPVATTGLIVFVIMVLLAVLAPLIAPYDYVEMNPLNRFSSPSWKHLCGTDDFGRDIFSRLLYGARYSLSLGIAAQILQLTLGVFLGCIAGYYGGRTEQIIMRACDIMQAIPNLLLAIIISTALGIGFINTVIALGVGHVASSCRLIRAQFLPLRELEYVEAERSINCSASRLIFRHLLPNAVSPLIVQTTMGIGGAITSAAALSFLGLGVQPPTPEWGAMLTAATPYIRYYPYMIYFPGICIAIVVMALNLFGDGLRDALDPKLKQ